MTVPKACIFDLDGVIVDTAHFHFKSWKRLADTLNIDLSREQNESLKGVSREKSLKKILALGNKTVSDKRFQELMDKKNGWYLEYVSELGPGDILDGIPGFLRELKKLNVKLAIGSSSRNARRILKQLRLMEEFGAIIDGTNVKRTKPDPEVFVKGAAALEVDALDCLVFEDAVSGVRAAKSAGMLCIGVGSKERFEEADMVIPGFGNMTPETLFSTDLSQINLP